MKKVLKNKMGFTLVELLVVISIIGVLTMLSASSFSSSQIKVRDSKRKSELDALSKALMMYYNDNGSFPRLDKSIFGNLTVGLTGPNGIVYMRKTPQDPKYNSKELQYVYTYSSDAKRFNLFANLENKSDSSCSKTYTVYGSAAGIGYTFCYGIASPNTVIGDTLP